MRLDSFGIHQSVLDFLQNEFHITRPLKQTLAMQAFQRFPRLFHTLLGVQCLLVLVFGRFLKVQALIAHRAAYVVIMGMAH